MAAALAIATSARPLPAADQTYSGAAATWDEGVTPTWTPGPTFSANDNAIFTGAPAIATIDTSGVVRVNNIDMTGLTAAFNIADADANGTLTLNTTTTLTAPAAAVTVTISEAMAGGNFVVSGTTTKTTGTTNIDLSGANTFTGNLTVGNFSATGAGTTNVRLQAANAVPSTALVIVSGSSSSTSQFLMNGKNLSIAGLSVAGAGTRRFINNSATAAVLTINNTVASSTNTFSSQMGSTASAANNQNNFSVVKTGPGVQELTNATALVAGTTAAGEAYFGNTTISDGALGFATIGTSMNGASSSLLILDGGVIQSTAAGTFSRSLGTTAGVNLQANNFFNWTTNGGGFSAKGGQLIVNIGNAAGTLDWGSTVGTNVIGPLKFGHQTSNFDVLFQNPLNLNGAVRTINVADNATTAADFATLAGTIADGSGGTGGILKTGAGTLVLGATNTYTGTTTVSAGTLVAPNAGSLPGYNAPGSVSVGAAGTLVVRAGGATDWTEPQISDLRTNASFTAGSGFGFDVQTGKSFSVGSISGDLTFNKLGGGELIFTGASNPYTGKTLISQGVITVSSFDQFGATPGTRVADYITLSSGGGIRYTGGSRDYTLSELRGIVLGDGGGTIDVANAATTLTFSQGLPPVTGALNNNFVKAGAGTMEIGGGQAVNWTGTTTISNGVLKLLGAEQLPDAALNFATAGTFEMNGFSESIGRLDRVTTTDLGTVRNTGASAVTLTLVGTTNSTFAGTITDATGGAISLVKNGTANQTLAGTTNNFRGTLSVQIGTLTLQSIADSGAGSNGTGTVFMNATSATNPTLTFTNTANASTTRGIVLSKDGAMTAVINGSGASTDTTPVPTSVTLGSITTANSTAAAAKVLQLGGTSTALNTVAGNITQGTNDTLSLTKAGAGTWRLAGTNTYTGTTTISAGTLLVTGTHTGGSTYSVTGTLGGNGTISTASSSVTVNAGGKISPGTSPGTLNFSLGSGQLNLAAATNAGTNTGALLYELDSVGTNDRISVTSTATNGIDVGTLDFGDFAFTALPGFQIGQYVLMTSNTPIAGTIGNATGQISNSQIALDGTLAFDATNTQLLLNVVAPEPASVGVLAFTGLAYLARRRRVGA